MAPNEADPTKKGTEPTVRRRSLRAVFAADVAGFSGRMSLNETRTVNVLSEIRIIGRRALEKYNGWLFGMAGDGLFATFESAVRAVQCALEMQQTLSQRPDLKDLPLRIGIHLGEVLIDKDLPYGETLNIAARLEALADPGGILVSGPVMDAVASRVSATFEDRGIPHLKNIPRRIPTFAVKPPPERSAHDETLAGFSTLDRTTQLDRHALRQMFDDQAAVDIVRRPPAQETDGGMAGEAGPTLPPDAGTPTPEARPSQPAPPPYNAGVPAYAPIIAARPTALEKSLPEAVAVAPAAGNRAAADLAPPATSMPTMAFLRDITTALAAHVGPFAKLIVDREMKSNPTKFDLITKLEQHVPTEDERLVFRVRASHINARPPGETDV